MPTEYRAALHGNRLHPAKRVRLDWEAQEGRVRVTVGDEGLPHHHTEGRHS
ncbi:hypothetical protein R2B67_26410 [Streptomyces cyaneofuscatus]|uniref:hypothetical protein n=1 Tax=Streptomyces cyaneofuscatus TaxID=66883 RepID=UPI002954B773|nr:hypothetical protein [Streptomyces cyaneofuscatus]WOP11854.1 hypothetical protein R2B67_26410 [Streptomyces cyaneofuscatus]